MFFSALIACAAPLLPAVGSSTVTVTDVDALRGLPLLGVKPVRVARVLGYHAPGDRGGGEFWWDGASAEPDDGGTVFAPASNPPMGRWKRLRGSEPVSVTWFGATPDDGTDDTAAIQNAIDHCQEIVAQTQWEIRNAAGLYVPPGAYHVDGTLRIQDGVDLHGDDASATQIIHTGADDLLRIINVDADQDGEPDSVYNVSIRHLTLQGNGAPHGQSSQTRFGIYMFHGVRSCSFEDVTVLRCQTGMFLRRCYTVNIVGCMVMLCAENCLKWENATAGMISGCRFNVSPNGNHCAFITFDHTNDEETLGLLVESSSFQGSDLAGLYCRDVGNLSVMSCFFENNNRANEGYGSLHLEDVDGDPEAIQEHVVNVIGGFFTPGSQGGNTSRAIYVENHARVNLVGVDVRGSGFQAAIDIRAGVQKLNLIGNNFHGRPRQIAAGVGVEEMGSD